MFGVGQSTTVKSNITIDGIVFTGASGYCFMVGDNNSVTGPYTNIVLQNCELTDNSSANTTSASGVNCCPIALYSHHNCTVTNNYIHDNIGPVLSGDNSHFSAMYIWGDSFGLTLTNNTVVNSGNIHSKEATQYNYTVAYNYVDMTNKTPAGGPSQNTSALYGFNPDGGLGTLTVIHHNILIAPFTYIGLTTDTGQAGWNSPCQVYNNTCIASGNQASGNVGSYGWEMTTGLSPFSFYNNLFVDNGHSLTSNYGYMLYNTDGFTVCDYNCYGGNAGSFFMTVPPGATTTGSFTPRTFLDWKGAINGGGDAHSFNTVATFTNTGTFADQYHVTAGAAFNSGRIGGVSSGATTNMGAWDGTGRPGTSWVS